MQQFSYIEMPDLIIHREKEEIETVQTQGGIRRPQLPSGLVKRLSGETEP